MKKFLMLLILVLGLLTGCGGISDSDYINTVKSINFKNERIDSLANRLLRQTEFYLLNKDSLAFEDHQMQMVYLSYQIAQDEMFRQIKSVNPPLPEMKNLKWKVEGKTKKGKVLAVSTDLVLLKIPTEQDGDYVKLDVKDIKVYNKKDNSQISIDTVDLAWVYLDVIDTYGYKHIVKEEIIEDEPMQDIVEFYPSGRIKLIDNGVESCMYEDKPIDFKELENRIGTLANEIDTFKVTEENNGEHFSWQLGDIKLELEGLFLSKNLTAKEKEKLNSLKNILKKAHTKAMKFW